MLVLFDIACVEGCVYFWPVIFLWPLLCGLMAGGGGYMWCASGCQEEVLLVVGISFAAEGRFCFACAAFSFACRLGCLLWPSIF